MRISRKSVEKIQLSLTGQERRVLHMKTIISRSFRLRIRNVSDKSCRENQNILFMFNNIFSKIVPFIMWKNIVQRGRPQTIWRMRTACWLPKATSTHTETVYYSLLFHCNGCTNAPQCYVIRTVPALFSLKTVVDLKFTGNKTKRTRNVTPRLGFMSGRVNPKTVQHVNSRNTYDLCSAW